MRTPTRGFVASAVAAGALAALVIGRAAAGDGTAQAPAPVSSPYVIVIKNFTFSPSSVTIPVGATVTWKNDDGPAHTVTSTSPAFDSGNLDNGQHFTFTFLKAGTYDYVCSYHPNMTGQIVVQAQASPAPSR
jgi:plastocyanin